MCSWAECKFRAAFCSFRPKIAEIEGDESTRTTTTTMSTFGFTRLYVGRLSPDVRLRDLEDEFGRYGVRIPALALPTFLLTVCSASLTSA